MAKSPPKKDVQVLLIEADEGRAVQLQAAMRGMRRQVKIVADPDSALITLAMDPPDIIVLSIAPDMPREGEKFSGRLPPPGVTLCRRIRAVEKFSGPIIVLSDFDLPRDHLDYYRGGADEIHPREISRDTVKERMAFWFDNTRNNFDAFEYRMAAIDALLKQGL